MSQIRLAVLLLAFLLAAVPAYAEDAYIFEMLIFERPDGIAEIVPRDPELPLPDPKEADNLAQQEASERTLDAIATALRRKGMRILRHDAWRQVPVSRNSDTWHRIDNAEVSGLIRVARGRFLHLDAELFLPDMDPQAMFPITLKRRFRSEELHYIDHPRIGILIQADPVPSPADEQATSNAMIEPRPAEPQAGDASR